MGIRHMFWGAALAATLSATLVAQQAPVGFHSISCVRVKPGKSAAFHALLSGDYRKVEQARVDSGAISAFIALRTVIPAGTDAGCDYVLVSFYPGLPAAPLSGDEEMTAVLAKSRRQLHAAGVARSPQRCGRAGFQQHHPISGAGGRIEKGRLPGLQLHERNRRGPVRRRAKEALAAVRRARGERRRTGRLGREHTAISQRRQRPEPGEQRRHLSRPGTRCSITSDPTSLTRWKKVHPEMSPNDAFSEIDKACTINHTVTYKVEDQIDSSK